jgi:hypothetical protein
MRSYVKRRRTLTDLLDLHSSRGVIYNAVCLDFRPAPCLSSSLRACSEPLRQTRAALSHALTRPAHLHFQLAIRTPETKSPSPFLPFHDALATPSQDRRAGE